jgi:hypothetical protein
MYLWLSWPRSVRSVLALSLRTKRKRTHVWTVPQSNARSATTLWRSTTCEGT